MQAKAPQRDRFAECRERTLQGCGGHHEQAEIKAGYPVLRWICCADCPARNEVASAIAEDARRPGEAMV